MKNANKIILLLAIIATISLAAYCFYVKGLTHKNEIFISELESRLHETTDKLAT